MQEQQNIDLVKKLYGAFGKGDIDTIVDHLAGQLVWRFDAPPLIPYEGEHDTPEKVREGFFGSLASTQRDYALRTDEFIAQDDKVIMVGGYEGATVTATGKSFDLPLVHVWTIQNGKVKRFVNPTDRPRLPRPTPRTESVKTKTALSHSPTSRRNTCRSPALP